jgi:Zn finger protein HypA/HybF involved in hydrogenase expression
MPTIICKRCHQPSARSSERALYCLTCAHQVRVDHRREVRQEKARVRKEEMTHENHKSKMD